MTSSHADDGVYVIPPAKWTPLVLLIIYVVVFVFLSINPYDRAVWWAENIPILMIVGILAISFRWFQYSALSYVFMSFLIILHTIGGHFSFERVPFDFFNDLFGSTRNNYDRIAHFTVGFYAYPIAELLLRHRLVNSKWVFYLFPIFTIFTIASVYELIEWGYAINADPSAGIAVLGSQGDIWDAQKDMLADGLGAIFATSLFYVIHRKRI